MGGGNTAAGDAIYLSRICKKVYLVHRRDKLRATAIYHKRLEDLPNLEFVWNAVLASSWPTRASWPACASRCSKRARSATSRWTACSWPWHRAQHRVSGRRAAVRRNGIHRGR